MKYCHQAKWEKTCWRSDNKSRPGFEHFLPFFCYPDKQRQCQFLRKLAGCSSCTTKKEEERGRSDNMTNL